MFLSLCFLEVKASNDIDSIIVMSYPLGEVFYDGPQTREGFSFRWLNSSKKGLDKINKKNKIAELLDLFKSLEIEDTLEYGTDYLAWSMKLFVSDRQHFPGIMWYPEDKYEVTSQIMIFKGNKIEIIWVESYACVVIGRLRYKISSELKVCLDKLLKLKNEGKTGCSVVEDGIFRVNHSQND